MNVNSTKVKLFIIKYGINHAIHLLDVNHIIIITDVISAVRQIFNMSIHSYQLYSIIILKDLKKLFNKDPNNIIKLTLYSQTNHYGNLVKKRSTTLLFKNNK